MLAVWIPLVASLIGAIVGAGIGAWAVFHNSRKEEENRRNQAARALKERGIVELLFQTASNFFQGAGNQGNPAAREHLAPDLKSVMNISANT